MTTKVLDFSNLDRKLFWALASLIMLCLAFYAYSVFSLTMNVVERDRIVSLAHDVSAQAGDIEREYLTRQNEVTLTSAEGLGLKEVSVKFAGGDIGAKLSIAR